jgi:membrane-bound lytic murein transglycosylase D
VVLAVALVALLTGCTAHRQQPADAADVAAAETVPDDELAVVDDGTFDTNGGLDGDAASVEETLASFDTSPGESGLSDAVELEEPEPEPEPEPDPAQLVAEALESCEVALQLWEQGDIATALHTLDNAYGLLLQIPDDEAGLLQEKEDLRHLISRRVVEIYRSRLTSAVDHSSPIPVERNEWVNNEIKRFQGGERQFFMDSYRRSGLYRPMIVRMLKERGLPEELSWLPLVESGFKTRALSRARALGMWQFISSTGYRYGLSRSTWIDERMDPERSTEAAIDYLTELHGMFGDWMLALAGYNCGEHRVMRVITRQPDDYLDHFWDVFEQLPRETARYVPRFLATLMIVRDPEAYGFELPEPLPPVGFVKVNVERHVQLGDLDRVLGLEKDTLAALNPELRHGITPDSTYALRVPNPAAPSFEARLAELPPYTPPQNTYTVHRVRRGETLSTIARRYGSSVNAIVRENNLRSRHRIREGQKLKIPVRGGAVRASTRTYNKGEPVNLTHTVRRGDSLWRLASRYGTTVDRIKRDNGLRSDRLTVGQKLRINNGVPEGALTYAVRRGDTLGKIARAHRVSLNSVLRANGLSTRSTIYPGQVLVIPK